MEWNHSIALLVEKAGQAGKRISDVVLSDQAEMMETSQEKILERMKENLEVMRCSVRNGLKADTRSVSGLTGGDAFLMQRYAEEAKSLSGSFSVKAIAKAIAVGEHNAAMGKIVAAPTAGASGILPAAVLTLEEECGIDESTVLMALITAGALGLVLANRASISGAEGGCQAECGSAAAMAAGAMVEMAGGSPAQVGNACAIALKNQLGLVCDPVAGLVEVPCIKRNAAGVMCAITAAEMALAGIKSVIPVDEVIDAMREVGKSMPCALKETAQGGLAATPTAQALKSRILG